MPTKKKTHKKVQPPTKLMDAQTLNRPSKDVQLLLDVLKEKGTETFAKELVAATPFHEGTWLELRSHLPAGIVDYRRGGRHTYFTLDKPNDYLPDAHPQIYILEDTKTKARPPALTTWVLCSFCGKPIRVDAPDKPVVAMLTNCPHVTPQWRGSGWIVETIPIPYVRR